jgi:hypothetical protein
MPGTNRQMGRWWRSGRADAGASPRDRGPGGVPESQLVSLGRGRLWLVLLWVLLLAVPGAAAVAASDDVTMHSSSHPDFGRIVFDTPASAKFHTTLDGKKLSVHFSGLAALGKAPPTPRNVRSINIRSHQMHLIVTPGATARAYRLGNRVVLDVFDPASRSVPASDAPARPVANRDRSAALATPPAAKSGQIEQSRPASAPPEVLAVEPPPPPSANTPDAAPPLTLSVPASAPSELARDGPAGSPGQVLYTTPQAVPAGPVALIARRVRLPTEAGGTAFALPFGASVGAALVVRGPIATAIFDERRPIDLSGLRNDPAFGETRVLLAPRATVLRMPVPAGRAASLTRTAQGWVIGLHAASVPSQPINLSVSGERIDFTAEQAGTVVSVADADSGATLLVGTQRRAGQGIMTPRHTAEFDLLPSVLGVVIEPVADTIALRTVPAGFALTGAKSGLALSPSTPAGEALIAAARLTRRFDFPSQPPEAMAARLARQIAAAAAAGPGARGEFRRQAAESMIALGMAAEAEALLQLVAAQDPKEAASLRTIGLTAISAILANRPGEADGIEDPGLAGTDDVALWRAIRQAMLDDRSAQAAAGLAATAPLLFTYPPPIRDRVLPLSLETMIQGGQEAPAARLMAQRKDDPRLGFARALLSQAKGNPDAALRQYDALANGRDQLDRARSSWRAVELRLSTGKTNEHQAADALDKLSYVWRGDRRELALRLRVAELQRSAGLWRVALGTLRRAETDFPAQAPGTLELLRGMFAALLGDNSAASLPPLELVALVEENADLLPDTAETLPLQERLADRLVALDLPKRADVVLEKLVRSAHSGPARATFGARLAALRLRDGDAAGAIAALKASDADDLSPALAERRAILLANATAHTGDTAGALAALAAHDSAAADEARASIQEAAGNWLGAELALASYVARFVPNDGILRDDQRQALLRLATAAARAGDDLMLSELRVRQARRFGAGPMADMFSLLTAEPVRGPADLARAKRETGLARAVPAGLASIQPRAATR